MHLQDNLEGPVGVSGRQAMSNRANPEHVDAPANNFVEPWSMVVKQLDTEPHRSMRKHPQALCGPVVVKQFGTESTRSMWMHMQNNLERLVGVSAPEQDLNDAVPGAWGPAIARKLGTEPPMSI